MQEHNLSKKQIEAILKLNSKERYKHTIKQIVGWGELWSLSKNQNWMLFDNGEAKFFPIWPAKEYANMCKTKEWEQFKPESIDLDFFLENIFPSLEKEGINTLIFKTLNDAGLSVPLMVFKKDLLKELENY